MILKLNSLTYFQDDPRINPSETILLAYIINSHLKVQEEL